MRRFRFITLPLLRPLIGVQLLFGVIYAAYQYAIPTVMFGSNPARRRPDDDLHRPPVLLQQLYGLGAAASTMLMLAMLVGGGLVRPSGATWRCMTAITLCPARASA